MNKKNCNVQDSADLSGRQSFRLGKVSSLGIACIVSTIFTGCAHNPQVASGTMPTIKPIYITHSSDTADSYYTLGKYYFWQNRSDKAQEAFQQALKFRPDSVDALNGMGAVYDRLGQFEAAQHDYRLALNKAPDAAYIWANLGYSLLLQGRAVMAVALLEKAVKLDPENAIARRHLALATEEVAKLAAISPEIRQGLSILDSTPIHFYEESARADTKSVLSILAEEARPAGNDIAALIPHESVKHSNVIRAVVTARNISSAQGVTVTASASETRPVRAAALPATPAANSYAAPVLTEATMHDSDRIRIEISNGNGINGMAMALRTTMKSEGVNVTRVTNARPFNKPHTVIICANEIKESAKAIARLLPGNPSITIGSTAYRNVEIRVVLGEDAVLAWNNSRKVNVAALDQ